MWLKFDQIEDTVTDVVLVCISVTEWFDIGSTNSLEDL